MDNGASSYRRFLQGDESGFGEIVRDYKDGLILYLNSFVNNISVAEELMEETFFKLITKKPRFHGKYTFKTWLYTVGRNVAIDYLRHSRNLPIVSFEEVQQLAKEETDLENLYIAQDQKIALHRAIKNLHPDYRQVLCLIYLEGFSSGETAIIMRKNSRQLRNLLYRAKKALKTELERGGFIYERL